VDGRLSDLEEVPDHVHLGEAPLREQHLVRVRDADLTPIDLEGLVLRRCHPPKPSPCSL
jgi:hypothetical protein